MAGRAIRGVAAAAVLALTAGAVLGGTTATATQGSALVAGVQNTETDTTEVQNTNDTYCDGVTESNTNRGLWACGSAVGLVGRGATYSVWGQGGSTGVYGTGTNTGVLGIGESYGIRRSSNTSTGIGVLGSERRHRARHRGKLQQRDRCSGVNHERHCLASGRQSGLQPKWYRYC
jgi:hypothetical protein